MHTASLKSPMGHIRITATSKGITEIHFDKKPTKASDESSPALERCVKALSEYLQSGKSVDVELDLQGTPFQKKVWKALLEIPAGQTMTYGEIAKKIGHPKAVRAVGTAVGKNPVCILVPCHRVVPKSGGIGKFSAGVERKKWLLKRENVEL